MLWWVLGFVVMGMMIAMIAFILAFAYVVKFLHGKYRKRFPLKPRVESPISSASSRYIPHLKAMAALRDAELHANAVDRTNGVFPLTERNVELQNQIAEHQFERHYAQYADIQVDLGMQDNDYNQRYNQYVGPQTQQRTQFSQYDVQRYTLPGHV